MSNGDLSGNVRVLATAVGDGVAASIAASSGVSANNAGTPAIVTGDAAAVILSNTRVSVAASRWPKRQLWWISLTSTLCHSLSIDM